MEPASFVSEVRRVVDRLRQLDRRRAVFGASTHDYAFAPPLGEAVVAACERRNGITLPASYRAFITRLGNGGPGPYYGVLPFDPESPLLAQPFPHEAPRPELPDAELEEPLSGCVRVADYGCGIELILIVKGPNAGQVWWDARSEEQGLDRAVDDTGAAQSFDAFWLAAMRAVLDRFEQIAGLMARRTPHEEIHRLLDGAMLQLEVDQTMSSVMDEPLSGTPRVTPDKPWGRACGLADEQYSRWLKKRRWWWPPGG